MSNRLFVIILVVTFSFQSLSKTQPSALQMQATTLFEQSVTHHLQIIKDGAGIELAVGELFEDDGPASGHSYQKPENRETVTNQIWIKKELLIPNPAARAAYLVVLSDTPVETILNGTAQNLGTNQSGRPLHQKYAIDPKLLRAG